MIKNIIFDFDGVICESVDIKTDAFYEMYLVHGEEIASKVKKYHIENGGMSRYEKFKHYEKEFLGEVLSDEKMQKLSTEFSNLVKQKVITAPFVDGILEFLKKYSQDYKCFIVSATPMDEMEEICIKKSISKYFEKICGSPTSKNIWVEKILKNYNLNKNETLFIGDALSDYNASQYNEIMFLLRNTPDNLNLFQGKTIKSINGFTDFNTFLKELTYT